MKPIKTRAKCGDSSLPQPASDRGHPFAALRMTNKYISRFAFGNDKQNKQPQVLRLRATRFAQDDKL